MFPKGRRKKFTVLTPEQAAALLEALPRHRDRMLSV
jgi:DNA-binding MarR family transcriptional regulator